jgi:thiamine biosynthesis lipoprotein
LIIIIATVLVGCADEQSKEQISETRLLLNTFCTITVHGSSDTALLDEAFELCAEYEAMFSMTVENSDIWRINHAKGEPVEVSPHTIDVIMSALVFSELSEGMFDITIGRLSRLWDFGKEPYIPSAVELEAVRKTIDYRKVRIVENTVQLTDPDTWLDLGAIAKGYIADRVAEFLISRDITGAIVDLGGDIVVAGSRQDGSPWRIGIRKPGGTANELLGVVETGEASIASSGIYERKFEQDGIVYHHILDPFTGMPARSDVVSATVVAENAVLGEGLSTIIVLAGSKSVEAMMDNLSGVIGAVVLLENGELLRFGDMRWSD